jgi:hypothetical protein
MKKNKIYEKRAHLYPVITSMLVPLFLLIILSSKYLSEFNNLKYIWNIAITIIPAGLVTTAIGFGVKNIARSTSKMIFQFPLFKEDETQMPTTDFLLWSNEMISNQRKTQIRLKIKQDIGISLFDEEQERENPYEARQLIVDAVKQIREKTRDNGILFNYNCNYGFMRNFLGANLWALAITLMIIALNFYKPYLSNFIVIGSITVILIEFIVAFAFLKQNSREYGRQLFTAFMEL